MILVDAGPLIALIHEGDNEHQHSREAFAALNEPAGHSVARGCRSHASLEFLSASQEALWEMIEIGAVEIMPLGETIQPSGIVSY